MLKRLLTIGCSMILTFSLLGKGPKRTMVAHRTAESVKLDGVLSEDVWSTATIAKDFTQLEPQPGIPASNMTEVRVLYDDFAIYIGATLYVDDPSQISKQIFERDNANDEVQTDWFAVAFDTYMDGINGSAFFVGPSECQSDVKFSSDGDDDSWDAVWDAKVQINQNSWVVEMQIPYAALRFPDQDIQTWHIQFMRKTFNLNEESFWSEIDPQIDGFFNQAGILEGIKDIKSPVRFSATPFIAYYTENVYDKTANPRSAWGSSFNGGMDIKYGISDAFTLDMTLIPDFGQARSDNQVLNLSPFEVRFDENRQFFTEGVELFNKAGLFYSRRVGGNPFLLGEVEDNLASGEEITSAPGQVGLYNATKISGRTTGGTGLGLFNAVAQREYATVVNAEGGEREVLVNPLTNYNVMVVDQNLNNNSYFSLINTNVWREGRAYDANVTGTEFLIRDKENAYFVSGNGALSQKYFGDRTDLGFKARLEVGEQKGLISWWASYNIESDTYDPNDLGFIQNNNEKGFAGSIRFNQYEAFGPWLRMGGGVFARYSSLYRFTGGEEMPQFRDNLFTQAGMNLWWYATTRNFFRINISTYFQPFEEYNYFEPRTDGRFYTMPEFYNLRFRFGTDNRKQVSLDGNMRFFSANQEGRHSFSAELEPSIRLSDKFSIGYSLEVEKQFNDEGYVTDNGPDDIIFGRRDRLNMTHLIRANLAFNANQTLSFRLRHAWSRVGYNSFHNLQEDGSLITSDYAENEDLNFNAFTIDAVYRWRFAPGSDIFVVWKNAIVGVDEFSDIGFGRNLSTMFNHPMSNSLSIKVLYFLDYQDVKKSFASKNG